MKLPKPLQQGSRIAITAFSTGITKAQQPRFNEIVRTLTQRGYEVVLGQCLVGTNKHVSAQKEVRAQELMQFLMDDSIDAIAPPWGGELAIELLPLLDFDSLAKAQPKWLFGFSDVSTITSVLCAKLGWMTVHSSNLMDLIDTNTDALTSNTLRYLEQPHGSKIEQDASLKHTRNWPDIEKFPTAALVTDQTTQWKWLTTPNDAHTMAGRLIGGCWDILPHLFETPYLSLQTLKRQHKEGILLYLENVEHSPCDLVRTIHSMAFRGVFESINGLVLGRNFALDPESPSALTYHEVLQEHLANKGIPVVYDVDIGHVPPNLTLFNGAYAELELVNGQGKLTQWLS